VRRSVRSTARCSNHRYFRRFPIVQAQKFVFDVASGRWRDYPICVRLDSKPFAVGGLRLVHHIQEVSSRGRPLRFKPLVAKTAKNSDEPYQTYFRDAEMQRVCVHYANRFNDRNPPKKIQFAEACEWML